MGERPLGWVYLIRELTYQGIVMLLGEMGLSPSLVSSVACIWTWVSNKGTALSFPAVTECQHQMALLPFTHKNQASTRDGGHIWQKKRDQCCPLSSSYVTNSGSLVPFSMSGVLMQGDQIATSLEPRHPISFYAQV